MKSGDVVHGYRLIRRLDKGGSDRKFFRCRKGENTFVLVYDEDLVYYMALQQHLSRKKIPVPILYWCNLDEKLMVQEDLGDVSLFTLRGDHKDSVRSYRLAIDELIKLQIDGRENAPVKCFYDREHVQWEQEYFRDFFLIQYCGIPAHELKGIDADFRLLADQVLTEAESISDYLMHRDFQSQNIYLKAGKIRIIDFQSARLGPLTYDLAALLRDAYVNIDAALEQELFRYYLRKLEERKVPVEEKEFWHMYELTCLQRNMQALGAFANLSLNKGKPHFAQHIPRGFTLLKRGLHKDDFPKISAALSTVEI
jgi:aminoglycoside/choline kinase family phosphotransferase